VDASFRPAEVELDNGVIIWLPRQSVFIPAKRDTG
jgi:hypothetical protein